MNEILKISFSLSVSGSIIAIILFALKPLLKDHFSKTWQYYIWLLVIARFLLPFSLEANITDCLFSKTADMITAQNVRAKTEAHVEIPEIRNGIPAAEEYFTPYPSQSLPWLNGTKIAASERTGNNWREVQNNLWLSYDAAKRIVAIHRTPLSVYVKQRNR